jgi:putative membrane protein
MWHAMWGWNGDWSWGWFGLVHLLWWGLLFALLVAFVRAAAGRRLGEGDVRDRSLAMLRERYARGEIDRPEYDERMQHLRDSRKLLE